jgi:hypothetical protein
MNPPARTVSSASSQYPTGFAPAAVVAASEVIVSVVSSFSADPNRQCTSAEDGFSGAFAAIVAVA